MTSNLIGNNKLINDVLLQSWRFYVSRKFNWYLESSQIEANSKDIQKKYLGFYAGSQNYLILNGDEYYLNRDVINLKTLFNKHFEEDQYFFSSFKAHIQDIVRTAKRYQKNLQKKSFTKLSLNELLKEHDRFYNVYLSSLIPSFSRPDNYLNDKLKNVLQIIIQDKQKRTEALDAILTCPNLGKLTYSSEPVNLLKIVDEIKYGNYSLDNLPKSIQDHIENHVKKYSWLKSPVGIYEDLFTVKDFKKRIINQLNNPNYIGYNSVKLSRKNQETNYKRVIGKYNFGATDRLLIQAVRDFIFLRTYSTETSDELFFNARISLFKCIGQRLGISSEDVLMLSKKEIDNYLTKGRISLREISEIVKNRRNSFSILVWRKNMEFYFGRTSKRINTYLTDKLNKTRHQHEGRYITGNIGNKGYVVGRVKIVNDSDDTEKVNIGDILVSTMTTPDLIAGIEKASGFITDEGGMCCHAAIVSREFKVPCIVGTKNATRLLKDDDIVILDANKNQILLSDENELIRFTSNRLSENKKILRFSPLNYPKARRSRRKILWLEEVTNAHYSIIGGKGANLARLFSAGFNVPNAFIITTNLFKNINNINETEILDHYKYLNSKYVSIRSSATVEDSNVLSFAGQFDTFLNVSRYGLIKKIRECQNSIYNERLKKYCLRNLIDINQVQVAVIVQTMVRSKYSGVIFTKNPVTGNRNELIIEATQGLGELLVSGRVTPQTYIIDKKNKKGFKKSYFNKMNEFTKEKFSSDHYMKLDTMTPNQFQKEIPELIEIALKIEKLYDNNMDIEWAIDNAGIHILQARQITT
jgi:pyruvate,water dikinase